ncbi:helix-turn-helix domain-containing protein [Lacisediminihabitans sp.]|jgi:transcriptional regulator GlxA family with amidase domain|uniref:helix-turn-helix domain-containing protein n=1 Tax=Lacisediminihabitans sp. TaxID=2787631 RepID=UPI002F9381A8
MPPSDSHHVVVFALPGVLALDFGIPVQTFGADSNYRLTICAEHPERLVEGTQFKIEAPYGLESLAEADTIVVPGFDPPSRQVSDVALDALRAASARGARIVSICTGAFALAAAGLLDGRPATTHWYHAALLQRLYPRVSVDPAVLFVDDGAVLTSAGVAAGIDLCLHIVRRDFGAAAANSRARFLVAAPHRSGGQSQFVERFVPPEISHGLAETREWLMANLAGAVTVDLMAEHAAMSRRTFIRQFRRETATTAMAWLTDARIDRARELLETTDVSVEQLGQLTGLGSTANVREQFRRRVGLSPQVYRRQFRQVSEGSAV